MLPFEWYSELNMRIENKRIRKITQKNKIKRHSWLHQMAAVLSSSFFFFSFSFHLSVLLHTHTYLDTYIYMFVSMFIHAKGYAKKFFFFSSTLQIFNSHRILCRDLNTLTYIHKCILIILLEEKNKWTK